MALAAAAGLGNLAFMAGRFIKNNPTARKFIRENSLDLIHALPIPVSEPGKTLVSLIKREGVSAIKEGVDPFKIAKNIISNPVIQKTASKQISNVGLKGLKRLAQKDL